MRPESRILKQLTGSVALEHHAIELKVSKTETERLDINQ